MRTVTRERFKKIKAAKTVTAPAFATLLKLDVATMKRQFDNRVLPEEILDRRSGKHWRIRYTEDDLRRCRAAVAIWEVFRRKPRASRDHDRIAEIDYLLDALIFRGDFALRPRGARHRRFWLSRKRDAQKWRELLLSTPNETIAAACILWLAVLAYRAKNQDQRPSPRELAELLDFSERSLYRKPFGKGALALALRDAVLVPPVVEKRSPQTDSEKDDFFCDRDEEVIVNNGQPSVGKLTVVRPPTRTGDDARGRSLKRKVTRSPDWEWEKTDGGVAMLVVYPRSKLHQQRRWRDFVANSESVRGSPLTTHGPTISRKTFPQLAEQRRADPSFGGWAAGRCFRKGKKWVWELNFEPHENGITDSSAQAKHEIESRVTRALEKGRQKIVATKAHRRGSGGS